MRRGRKTAKLAMARSLAIALLLGHITKECKIRIRLHSMHCLQNRLSRVPAATTRPRNPDGLRRPL